MRGITSLVVWFLAVGLAATIFILLFKALAGALPGQAGQGLQGVAGRV